MPTHSVIFSFIDDLAQARLSQISRKTLEVEKGKHEKSIQTED